ncbi:MAG: hypothetical protein RTU30_01575 [Candidatus Thorarchaeota archaeon]
MATNESKVTCVFCSKPVAPEDRVRYRGFIAHATCAVTNRDQRIKEYTKTPFRIGIIGAIIGILTSIPLMITVAGWNPLSLLFYLSYNVDYTGSAFAYAGLAISMPIASIGLFGLFKNYQQALSLAPFVLGLIVSCFFAVCSALLFIHGPDPQFYDPVYGTLIFSEIPGFILSQLFTVFSSAIVSMLVAVSVLLLEGTLASQTTTRVLAIGFMIAGGVLFAFHIGILVMFGFLIILYLIADVPDAWLEQPTREVAIDS